MKPKITINYEKTQELADKIWKTTTLFDNKEFERSDLLETTCPIKCYNRFKGVKVTHGPKLIAIFLIGEALHQLMQKPFELVEVKRQLLPNTNFRIDVVWDKITEIKTTISQMTHPSHIKQNYLDQLECALCFIDDNTAYLITLDIVSKTLLVWNIEYSDEHLVKQAEVYKNRLRLLNIAIRMNNPLLLEPNFDECGYCFYKDKCLYFIELQRDDKE